MTLITSLSVTSSERLHKLVFQISDDGKKLTISQAALANAGMYTCIALNRAGEASLEFKVEILCTNLATLHCRELENNFIARQMPHAVTKTRDSQSDAYREHMRKYEEYLRKYEEGLQRQRDENLRRQNRYWEMRRKQEAFALVTTTTSSTTTTTPSTTTSTTKTTSSPEFVMPWVYNPKFGHPLGSKGVMSVKATVQHPTRLFRSKRVRPVLRCFLYDPLRHVFLREKSSEYLPPSKKGFLKYPLNNKRIKRT